MSSSTSRLTPVQLHQRLIHAESEITRLTKELNRYKNDYHYNMIDELLTENERLLEEITALKEQLDPSAKNEPVIKSHTHQPTQQKETSSKVTETSRTTLPADESIFFSSKAKLPDQEEQDSPETDDQTTNWFSRSIKSRTKK
ncbi:hypothetical protein ABC345_12925 [Shouchella sp. 1P09AA]|uniref:hypothetical protein n=1 Tax=unclassified Shouchella TaxID=2893065 RepID=UPI0039A32D2B